MEQEWVQLLLLLGVTEKHTQPVIHAFLGDVDSGALDKNGWIVNLKVKELIITKS